MAPTYRVDCKGQGGIGSGPFLNSFYVDVDGGSALNPGLVATAFKNFYTTCNVLYANALVWTVPSQITSMTTPPQLMPFTPNTVAGISGATSDAPQLALVVTWRTALAGPSFRGRSFLGPLHGGTTIQGSVVSASVTAAQTASTALIAAIKAIPGHNLVVYSRFHNKAERPSPVVTPIESAVSRTVCYTQRRRQIR